MVYGFTLDEVRKVNHPPRIETPWGFYVAAARRAEYALTQLCLKKGRIQPLHYSLEEEGTFFVEEGRVVLRLINRRGEHQAIEMDRGDVFHLTPGLAHGLYGIEDSYLYLFSNKFEPDGWYNLESEGEAAARKPGLDTIRTANPGDGATVARTFDFRDKYWGSIESIVSEGRAAKRICMKAGAQNSLEFHCNKIETYFVHSGSIRVGLRMGRGENKSVIISAGDAFEILPGVMHMKIGITDSVVMEISTRDDDRDSHLVEDGQEYKHVEH